jgi:hypothetical protein
MALTRTKARVRQSELSSASRLLTGQIFDGRTVKRVEKLGARRRIVFTQGRPGIVDRATIHEFAKAVGWKRYREKLVAAATPKDRREMITASVKRQFNIRRQALSRYAEGKRHAPPHVAKEIERRMRSLRRMKWGSPIVGDTPVTSAVPPHHGPAKTFSTIARTGIRFQTIKRKGRVRVIPIVGKG